MKSIQVDRDVFAFLQSRAAPGGETPAMTLRRELQVPEPQETIELDDDTYNFLLARAVDLGESPSDILRRELHLSDTPPPGLQELVIFRIPPGTGTQPWNTRDRAVQALVGNTLRIVNDDAVSHRLHTNGTPFAHPNADIEPGESADFLLQTTFSAQPLHDHNVGLGAQFWITVR